MKNHREAHKLEHIGWLRAAVLGANDGIVSTSSLILGIAATHTSPHQILIAGIAGLAAGAMSMAAGEYVSVSSQADSEKSALEQEDLELKTDPTSEVLELTQIYIKRGLEPALARMVAGQLMANDALTAHMRDELGISETAMARPLQAAFSSAASFAAGAVLPLIVVAVAPKQWLTFATSASALLFLAGLGALSARIGGGSPLRSILRIMFWSAIAMAVTYGIGAAFGTLGLP